MKKILKITRHVYTYSGTIKKGTDVEYLEEVLRGIGDNNILYRVLCPDGKERYVFPEETEEV